MSRRPPRRGEIIASRLGTELERRGLVRPRGPQPLDLAFSQQRELIEDTSRLKAACCTRRAGKTFGVGLYIWHTALNNPGCTILYLSLTRQSAKEIVMRDVLERLDRELGTGVRFNYSELTLTFPNGSIVYINGADTSDRRHEMFAGKKYKLVIIDEAQYWKSSLFSLIREKLGPAMSDVRGTICMIGVPDAAKGFFWEVCTGARGPTGALLNPGWTVHNWSAADNPHMRRQWQADLDEMLDRDPGFCDTATFKMQWLGQWVDDPGARVYPFSYERNTCGDLPGDIRDYRWILSVDTGWDPDPTAVVLSGWNPKSSDGTLYIVHCHKETRLTEDQLAAHIHELEKRYQIGTYVIDPSNGRVVETLQGRLGIPFIAADRHSKAQFIGMMRGDIEAGRVKVVRNDRTEALLDEWNDLVWDRRDPQKPRENSSFDNHLSDAALYGWRRAFHWAPKAGDVSHPVIDRPSPHSSEWLEGHQERLRHQLTRPVGPGDLDDLVWGRR